MDRNKAAKLVVFISCEFFRHFLLALRLWVTGDLHREWALRSESENFREHRSPLKTLRGILGGHRVAFQVENQMKRMASGQLTP
jgi:hypothetical protein